MNPNINKLFGNLNFIMNYARINVKFLTFLREVNPSPIDLAPKSPI